MFNLNADTAVNRFLARLTDLFLLQLLFILTSIPLITIGAGISAVFSVCRKLRQDSISGVISCYFRDFAANWKQATAAWLLFLLTAVIVFVGFRYYATDDALSVIGRLLIMLVAVAAYLVFLYLFPMLSWLEHPLLSQMKNALVLSLLHLKTTILATGTLIAAFFVARYVYPIFLFGGLSATIYIISGFFLKTLSVYSPDLVPPETPPEEESFPS